jgi:hypothetical protein
MGLLNCVLLASDHDELVVAEPSGAAIVRVELQASASAERFEPFEVLEVPIGNDPPPHDPGRPELVVATAAPRATGMLHARKRRRLLKALCVRPQRHLLGVVGNVVPYADLSGTRPSVGLFEPSRGPVVYLRDDGSLWARFGWPGSDYWLVVEDRALNAALHTGALPGRALRSTAAGRRLDTEALERVLGFRPCYLLVSLSRPANGFCRLRVQAMLPKG